MLYRAYWQFYKTIFPFIAAFSIMSLLYLGLLWAFVLFATAGLSIGFLGFQTFYYNQFYFYFNLGITKWKLFKVSFIINLLVGIPIFLVLLIIIRFLFGNIQIT
ncbi:hypothetical protein Aeqsu_3039 [Aequorivita sublithincola DSM 14238]|uniref:Uncharacterized protein n=1 Tax=Aequorivita sublithincola (strain DSM 14238 / LMG 21431 / ACAM 643 / 9-3) TaxID=746697 RepID=I3YZQ9_AEQSU|nr:hypothetical protein [Aequorivita sublithincola]AFL82477.1 hypothetical protein Aeqsu_3039 [Aequorivita sublithincola DSM 14238]